MKQLQSKTILIVDDENDIREIILEILEASGYKATGASNGRDALRILNKSEKPAVIFLDLVMPEMDGFEFMRAKELISEIEEIPVIVISASGRLETLLTEFNVQGYIKKPISLEKLLEAAERYCG